MERRLTIAANVAIIIAVVAILVSLVRNEVVGRTNTANFSVNVPRPTILVGHSFPIQQQWTPYRKTVVLALSVGCRFCSASAPFYRDLAVYAANRRVNIVALLPQNVEDSAAYLKKLGVAINSIQQINFADIKVSGTPTLFVIDNKGVVEKVWEGQLQQNEQSSVLSTIS